MNLSTLQPAPRNQVQWSSTSAEGKEASFLTFNYVNKHARVRISPIPLDLSSFEGKGDFLAVANTRGWFAAITRSSDGQTNLVCSPLSQLHIAFATNPGAGVDEIDFTPQRILTISPATPNILTLAYNETRLLVGSIQGPIAVYDCSQLFSQGMNNIGPIHTFSGSVPCEQIAPNPGDIPELVAVLRRGDHPSVEMLNLQNYQLVGGWASGGTLETTPSSLSWSPRGKQLAIGLHNGDIATFSPTSMDSPKSIVSKPPSAGDSRVLSTTWLANPTFHIIYGPPGPVSPKMSQSHHVVNFDSKSNSAADVTLSSPYYPFPGLRPPGSFVLALRNWDPVKFLLFVGDSTSSDIGSIGCFVDSNGESWNNLSLDEAYIPSLPLDKSLEDTVLLGLELDLTAKNAYDHITVSGEKLVVPPPPIVYAYCSDGTVLAWHVVNASGASYPGMTYASASSSTLDAPMSTTPSGSTTAETKPSLSAAAFGSAQPGFGSFTQASKQPVFAQSGFAQPPQSPSSSFDSSQPSSSGFAAFAQGGNQPFGKSHFGQTWSGQSSFGQSAFSQSSNHSAFNQPSGFSQPSFGESSFGKIPATTFGSGAPSSGGFASYASAAPAGFRQSSAFATSTSPTISSLQPAPEMTREISMSMEPQDSELGALSLGSDPSTDPGKTSGRGTTGLFGQSVSSPSTSSSGFGTSVVNPGFGAFSNWGLTKNETSTPPATTSPDLQKPTSSAAFGSSGFGVPAVGQNGFGAAKPTTPTFGQSSFGKSPVFGQSGFSTHAVAPSTSSTTTGGFGAYANAPASLTSVPPSAAPAKPIWAVTADEPSPSTQPAKQVFPSQQSTSEIPLPLSTVSESESVPKETEKPTSSAPAIKPSLLGPSSPSQGKQIVEPATPFKSSSSSPSGAFSNLKQSSVGFGSSTAAFGHPDTNSPFFKAADQSTSVFGSTSSSATPTTTPKPSTTSGPVFGSPSPLGTSVFGKPSGFGSPTTPTPSSQPSPPVGTGGFSAFAGSSGSLLGRKDGESTKSFSLLLKGSKDEEQIPKQPVSVFSLPWKDEEEKETLKQEVEEDGPVKVFSIPPLRSPVLRTSTPPGSENPPDSDEGGRDLSEDEISFKASSEEDEGDHAEDNSTSDTGSESFADESLSYEDLNAQLAEEEEIEGPHELSPVQEETSLHDESDADNVTSVQETLIQEDPPDPTKIPLPISRSSSAHAADASPPQTLPGSREASLEPGEIALTPTPKDSTIGTSEDTLRVKGTKLSSPSSSVDQLVELSPIEGQEPSTTPPSSPAKLAPVLPSPTPTPPFGRPSARPIRSSPLAGTPIIGENDESLPVASPSPSLLKPRPASPKPAFGQWASLTAEEKKPARPKTPPLSVIGPSPLTKPLPLVLPPLSFPAASPQPIPPLFPQASSDISGQTTAPVGAVPSSSLSLPGQTLQSAKVDLHTTPDSPAPGALLGQKMTGLGLASTPSPTPPSLASGIILNQRTPQTPSPIAAPISPGQPPKTTVSTIPEPSLQDGMQAECAYLFMSMNKELEDLKLFAEVVNRKRQNLIKAKPVVGTKADLGDPNKWSMADISAHGRSMKQLDEDVLNFKDMQDLFRKSIDAVESDMLKATTRKEEIVRFSKATSNAEFAKMLKSRTLSPEHLETQTKLRRQLRTIRDRVEKLEGILQASKKKLNRQKSGKLGFRAPSLDTINRTYRNIDLAIAQQADNISKLSSRVAKLDLKSLGKASSRDKRLPDKKSRKLNVTPSVAATTAAALNAERSAYKLKQVLLSVRDKPLLNDKAAHTSPSRIDFKTPQKPGDGWSSSNWQIPDTVSPSHSPSSSREVESPTSVGSRRGLGSKHHQKSATLKKQYVSTSPTPASAKFDWGPPPSIGLKTDPPTSLPFSIR